MSIIGFAALAMAAFCIGHNHGQEAMMHHDDDRCFIIYEPYDKDGYYLIWFEGIKT